MESRFGPRGALVASLFLLGTLADCSRETRPPPIPATVRTIQTPDELLWGPSAFGAIGDLRLENGKILAVVAAVDRPVGFASSGGNLVDAAPVPGGEDHLNQIFLYLNDEFPRQARYEKLRIVSKGGGKRPVVVRVSGVDSGDARIRIETDYILRPDANWITLATRFTSTASATIRKYAIGDAVQWGRAEHMAPGRGFAIAGSRFEAAWLGGIGEGTSYAFVQEGSKTFTAINGSTWSDPIAEVRDLMPGKPVSYVRHLVIGRGDTASLTPAISVLRGEPTGRVEGSVNASGGRVEEAKVRIEDEQGGLVGTAKVDETGWYAIDLPPGRYRLLADAPGREPVGPSGGESFAELRAGATLPHSFNLGPRASVAWRIQGHNDKAPPVKVTILGMDGTKNPDFGPAFRASGARNVVLSARGVGEIPVGVGKYRVIISRGPEFELIEETVTVGAGERPEVKGKLERSVNTDGFIASDLHQHSAPSFDSGVSMGDRVLSNAAEGVEVLVSTEHNVLTDFRPAIASSGLGRDLVSIIGVEATTHSVGHFNAMPTKIDRTDARGGMRDPEGWTPRQIFDFLRGLAEPGMPQFLQTNHPRAGRIGYFELMKLDPLSGEPRDSRFVTDFDGVEVIAFGFPEETERGLQDWFNLLERGLRVTATGNSDSHTVYGREVGWPRTLVCVGEDRPPRLDVRSFIESLKKGCATVSAGPFVEIRSGEVRMGGLLAAPSGRFDLEVKVQAPSWVPTDRLLVYVDGDLKETIPLPRNGTVRYEGRVPIACASDCFATVLVQGDGELHPVLARVEDRRPSPVALANPIYVDVDGDGGYRVQRAHP